LAPELLARADLFKEALLLRLAAVRDQRRPDEVDADVAEDARRARPDELGLQDDALAERRVAAAPRDGPVERDVAALGEPRLPACRERAALVGPRLLRVDAAPLGGQVLVEPDAELVPHAP